MLLSYWLKLSHGVNLTSLFAAFLKNCKTRQMSPIAEKKSWKEINKARKLDKKKWKEASLQKKLQKQAQDLINSQEIQTRSPVIKTISTVSIAVPGSILENAQSRELRTYLAGQIARAACVFQVDEIIVFDDYADAANSKKSIVEDEDNTKTIRRCCVQLAKILQYLECPQYLRKHIFPIEKDLKYAGILNPLDAPHHLRQSDNFNFREGIVTNKPVKEGRGSCINVGLLQDVTIDKVLEPGIRCTVKLLPAKEGSKKIKGVAVGPNIPRIETGVYWGYNVRLASSLSQVFSQSPYKDGYDVTIGTSEKGTSIDDFKCPKFEHMLVVFGGLAGLESALENDDGLNVSNPELLFKHYLNTLPAQGSRTIRTEEAILISMSVLRPLLRPKFKPAEFSKEQNSVEMMNTELCETGQDD